MIIIDPPAPFEPLAVWRRHLASMTALSEQYPESADMILPFIKEAEKRILDKDAKSE